MKHYVLGFAFSEDRKKVVLIRKNGNSVPRHKGLLNGVGGKVNPGETTYEAMSREFFEETGVLIPSFLWRHRGSFRGSDWGVTVFMVVDDKVLRAQTMEAEEVCIEDSQTLPADVVRHVPTLINFCLAADIKDFTWREV